MKMMVVEDSDATRLLVRKMLETVGYRDVVEASNGVEAWEKLNAGPAIAFLLTDWNMPEVDGLSLVNKIRKHPVLSDLPILVFHRERTRRM